MIADHDFGVQTTSHGEPLDTSVSRTTTYVSHLREQGMKLRNQNGQSLMLLFLIPYICNTGPLLQTQLIYWKTVSTLQIPILRKRDRRQAISGTQKPHCQVADQRGSYLMSLAIWPLPWESNVKSLVKEPANFLSMFPTVPVLSRFCQVQAFRNSTRP